MLSYLVSQTSQVEQAATYLPEHAKKKYENLPEGRGKKQTIITKSLSFSLLSLVADR